jgi:hypothetical protein
MKLTQTMLEGVNNGDLQAIAGAVTTRLPLLRALSHRYGSDDLVSHIWLIVRSQLVEAVRNGKRFDSVGRLGAYLNTSCRSKAGRLKQRDTIRPDPKRTDIYQENHEFMERSTATVPLNEVLDLVAWPRGQSIIMAIYSGWNGEDICSRLNLSRYALACELKLIRKALNGTT